MNNTKQTTLREIEVHILSNNDRQHMVRVLAETRAEAIEQTKAFRDCTGCMFLALFTDSQTDLSAA